MTTSWDLHTIAKVTRGALHGMGSVRNNASNITFGNITSDTRSDCSDALFVAIKGNQFDGHNYIGAASEKGAVAALTEQRGDYGLPYVMVENSIKALGLLGSHKREQSQAKIIGVTGSCGKTTVCNMLACILGYEYKRSDFHTTLHNHNNEIGVAQTLLGITSAHRLAVIEMGIRNPGDMAWLATISKPTTGLISCIGYAHLALLDSLKGVAKEKSDIYQQDTEYAIAPAGDADKYQLFSQLGAHTQPLTFGLKTEKADAYLSDVRTSADSANARLTLPTTATRTTTTLDIQMQVGGTHTLHNAAASALAAWVNGVSADSVAKGLADFTQPDSRQHLIQLDGITLIDDCYNANPTSMRAALENLSHFNHPTIAVLGDMFELGKQSELLHTQVGEYAASVGIAKVLTIGENAKLLGEGYANNAAAHHWQHFMDTNALLDYLNQELQPDTTILVKASRGMHLETIVETLISNNKKNQPHTAITDKQGD